MLTRFLGYYALVVLVTFAVIFIGDYSFQRYQQRAEVQVDLHYLFELADDYCRSQVCQPHTSLPFSQLSLIDTRSIQMPAESWQRLATGEILALSMGEDEIYYRAMTKDMLLQFGPIPAKPHPGWYVTAFYLLLATLILMGLYPLFRDMYRLREVSLRFSKNRQFESLQLPTSRYFQPVNDAIFWMVNKIARLLALQKELSHTLSHEMRTSLSRLNFTLAILDRDNLEECRDTLQEDIDELNTLVKEYLDFSRLEHLTPKLDLGLLNLTVPIRHYIGLLGQYSDKHIEFHELCTTPIAADERLMARAIKNLIDNAIKYSASKVLIRCSSTEQGVCVLIEDDGEGLLTDKIDELFMPYVRSGAGRNLPGYGLGLAITRKIVDWHGGTIEAGRSDSLGGACFKLVLPVSVPTQVN
ncbi:sensor histidine kinase KdpD [Shewanella amazonensis]|uniref:histidine kinase n=1 Tax=Shewanella amazonensis (strain ATCC BAA-1098 / SB2B) TaxID=326297 RepID=A1S946_SHEAM|nr:ATP-binding protein [Shewanella amazonensis]ABM00903.1 sensory histidine kinase in two-component regulatory system with RstA [Shewanella amazonensis SB2B]